MKIQSKYYYAGLVLLTGMFGMQYLLSAPAEEKKGSSEQSVEMKGLEDDFFSDRDFSGFYDLRPMNEAFAKFFVNPYGGMSCRRKGEAFTYLPSMDMQETPKEYVIRMDVPGIDKKDLQIEFEGKGLIVHGKKSSELSENEKGKVIRQERSYGEFARKVLLPAPVKKKEAKATCDKGVLTITVPKADKPVEDVMIPIV